MEIGITSAYLLYAVLAHEDGSVRVMEQIAGQIRMFRKHFCGHISVALRRDENTQSWRSEQDGNELPSLNNAHGLSHDP